MSWLTRFFGQGTYPTVSDLTAEPVVQDSAPNGEYKVTIEVEAIGDGNFKVHSNIRQYQSKYGYHVPIKAEFWFATTTSLDKFEAMALEWSQAFVEEHKRNSTKTIFLD